MPTMPDRFRRWFEYEKDSHAEGPGLAAGRARALARFGRVPQGRRPHGPPRSGPLAVAGPPGGGSPEKAPREPEAFFPRDVSVADLPGRVVEMEEAWEAYLVRLDDAEVSRVFEYKALDGAGFRNTVEDILSQLYGHSWYHRGQIAQLVRGLGAEPAVTDFIYWAREPLAS